MAYEVTLKDVYERIIKLETEVELNSLKNDKKFSFFRTLGYVIVLMQFVNILVSLIR